MNATNGRQAGSLRYGRRDACATPEGARDGFAFACADLLRERGGRFRLALLVRGQGPCVRTTLGIVRYGRHLHIIIWVKGAGVESCLAGSQD